MSYDLVDFIEKHIPSSSNNRIRYCGAYICIHNKTGKIYAGSTSDLYERQFRHKNFLQKGKHSNIYLQNAYNDDPNITFNVWITNTREEAFNAEQDILNKYLETGLLFNISPDARKASRSLPVSKETREKIGAAHRGTKHTAEHTEKIRAAQAGRKKTPEQIERCRLGHIGLKLSVEHKEKIGIFHKGKKRPLKTVENMRLAAKKSKPISIMGLDYCSINDAVRKLRLGKKTIRDRILNSAEEYKEWKFLKK